MAGRSVSVSETQPVEWILEKGGVVICAGGGGVPTTFDSIEDVMAGVEAVIDKDLASAVLARDLHADLLVIATDVDGVFLDWHTADERMIARAHPDAIDPGLFAAGSMGPKVRAAVQFANETSGSAIIGSLHEIDAMLAGHAGTRITTEADGIELAPATG